MKWETLTEKDQYGIRQEKTEALNLGHGALIRSTFYDREGNEKITALVFVDHPKRLKVTPHIPEISHGDENQTNGGNAGQAGADASEPRTGVSGESEIADADGGQGTGIATAGGKVPAGGGGS